MELDEVYLPFGFFYNKSEEREVKTMNFFDTFSTKLEKAMTPFTTFVNTNKSIQAISAGFISANPIILGASVLAIIANFPITAWTEFLNASGIYPHLNAIIEATTSMLALYISYTIAYRYVNAEDQDGLTAGLLSLAFFIIIMPHQVEGTEGAVNALLITNLGSEGLFVALIFSIIVAKLFVYLMKKGLIIKLPESVPEMVSRSLAPTFIAMIIFAVAFLVRLGFSFTQWETVFAFIGWLVGRPIVSIGSSVPAIIFVYTFMNFLWFFGIHPSPIFGVYMPVIMSINLMNTEAMQAGKELPLLVNDIVKTAVYMGGTGTTLGLIIAMIISAKSERYKAILKIAAVPNIFNVNEPLIFGMPMMMNPIFFLPMILSPIACGILAFLMSGIINPATYNPAVSVVSTVPTLMTGFFKGGLPFLFILLACLVLNTVIYLPFFKIADRKACLEEQTANEG